MSWKVTFFNSRVKDQTLKFPDGILSNLLHILEIIEEFGPAIGKPYTAPMGNVFLGSGLKVRKELADLFSVQ